MRTPITESVYQPDTQPVKRNPCAGDEYPPSVNEEELRQALIRVRGKTTIKEVAARMGVSPEWVSRHEAPPESERHASISIDDAHRWARALDHAIICELVPLDSKGQAPTAEARQVIAELAAVAARLDGRALRAVRNLVRDLSQGE
jgi:transcriptional regulator with XRE-family HTH domain